MEGPKAGCLDGIVDAFLVRTSLKGISCAYRRQDLPSACSGA